MLFQLWDARTLELIKTYVTERPVNAVTMSPLLDHVCIGGLQTIKFMLLVYLFVLFLDKLFYNLYCSISRKYIYDDLLNFDAGPQHFIFHILFFIFLILSSVRL